MTLLEAFEAHCKKQAYGEQWANDVFPDFAAGFIAGQRAVRRALKEEENNDRNGNNVVLCLNRTKRGNPQEILPNESDS